MRRWHSELPLMLKRRELRRHSVPADLHGARERGLSFWRKRHPDDCGNPRCGLCHSEKWERCRARVKQAAIDYERRATE